jgi:hypothetical protein
MTWNPDLPKMAVERRGTRGATRSAR